VTPDTAGAWCRWPDTVRSLGDVLAGPARDGEEILFADIDGHQARPDAFRLVLDEAPKPPVSPAQ
jgi:hypothetical protein